MKNEILYITYHLPKSRIWNYIDAVQSLKAIWLGKVDEPGHKLNQQMVGVLTDAGTRIVSAVRSNALDLLVCKIRDCFNSDVAGQYPVNAYTGKRSDLCFQREGGGKKNGNTTKAFLNTALLVKTLKQLMVERDSTAVAHAH